MWSHMVSQNLVMIGSGNGLLPLCHQAMTIINTQFINQCDVEEIIIVRHELCPGWDYHNYVEKLLVKTGKFFSKTGLLDVFVT